MLEHTGALFTYLIALKDDETGRIEARGINSLQCLLKDFPLRIAALREEVGETEPEDILEIYCILGVNQQTEAFMNQIRKVQNLVYNRILSDSDFDYNAFILQNLEEQKQKSTFLDHAAWLITDHTFCYDQLYALQQFTFAEADGELEVYCLGMGVEYEDKRLLQMQRAVEIWMEHEAPQVYGRQVIINSFWLNDLKGRRIIGALPQNDGDGYFLLVEGGKKVRLNAGSVAYMNEQIGYKDIDLFSMNDINIILNNPIYSYGIYFQPYEIFEDWQKVFQYAIAVLDVEWTTETLKKVYEPFLEFMENQICECMEAAPLLTKEMFFDAYLKTIVKMREYLCCKEETILSNDWLKMMGNRLIYLNNIYTLLEEYYPKEISEMNQTKTFELTDFRDLLNASEEGTAYEKGIVWEEVAAYMLERIAGLKVSGRRLRVARQEVDLCCINVSMEEELWNFGALILVECKNWKFKVDVKEIRSIGQIMYMKGTTTMLLFSRIGVTSEAKQEILQLALRGAHVLCITKSDLLSVTEKVDFYELLIRKWVELQQNIENDLGLLG